MKGQRENLGLVHFGKNSMSLNKSRYLTKARQLYQQSNCKGLEQGEALILPQAALLRMDHMSAKIKLL